MAADVAIQASRHFDITDQQAFAELSGDFNPMHMDAVYARRTQLGIAAVHGVHAALWAMEVLARNGLLDDGAGGIKVRFLRPIPVDEDAVLTGERKANGNIRFEIRIRGEVAVIGDLRAPISGAPNRLTEIPESKVWPARLDAPEEVELAESGNPAGSIEMVDRAAQAAVLFPALVAATGADRIQALASLSHLVGMVCPGLHSIFGSIDCTFHYCARQQLRFAPQAVDMRFRRLVQAVDAGCVQGRIESFFRPPPVDTAPMRALAKLVRPGEFAEIRALVIGGSRGLGATAAKLLAAGGAKVTVTYHRGVREAADMVAEAATENRDIRAIRFDVVSDDPSKPFLDGPNFNALYYFATPKIESGSKSCSLSQAILENFLKYYLYKFDDIYGHFIKSCSERPHIYYPSTVFIDDNVEQFQEYCIAKLAGETLCRARKSSRPDLAIITPRLPKILTDQTASVSAGAMADGPSTLLATMRQLHAQ
jgi:hypothetical protein